MSDIDNYFSSNKFSDDFGWSDDWNKEMNKWLQLLNAINPTHYKIFQNRANKLRGAEHRDALLGEIKTIYFVAGIMMLSILELEPSGQGSTKLEFIFQDLNSENWKTEVKAPSWRSQIMKNPNMGIEEKKERLRQPKIRTGDGGSFSPIQELRFVLEDSVKNALPKFVKGENNLLVITPDMLLDTMTMLAVAAMAENNTPIQQEMRMLDPDEIISAVLILEPSFPVVENKVVYHHHLAKITKSPVLPLKK